MLHNSRQNGQNRSLLDDYVNRFSDAVAQRRANVALRAARIEAELAYKTRGEFLANMNHELRTPLNAIVGFTNMLKQAEDMGLSKEQTDDYLDYILQSADLLLSHIHTILELAAAESGGAKMTRCHVSVYELLPQTLSKFEALADEANVSVELNIEPNIPDIEVDPDRTDTALSHLIENAITYCDEGDKVSIMVKKGRQKANRSWVYIAIKDTGIGMTPEELQRALRSFEQVHQGLHRRFEGSGIGLPIAKSFIELNGGKFDIKSQKGVGTSVRFALPGVVEEEKSAEVRKHLSAMSPLKEFRAVG